MYMYVLTTADSQSESSALKLPGNRSIWTRSMDEILSIFSIICPIKHIIVRVESLLDAVLTTEVLTPYLISLVHTSYAR